MLIPAGLSRLVTMKMEKELVFRAFCQKGMILYNESKQETIVSAQIKRRRTGKMKQ